MQVGLTLYIDDRILMSQSVESGYARLNGFARELYNVSNSHVKTVKNLASEVRCCPAPLETDPKIFPWS